MVKVDAPDRFALKKEWRKALRDLATGSRQELRTLPYHPFTDKLPSGETMIFGLSHLRVDDLGSFEYEGRVTLVRFSARGTRNGASSAGSLSSVLREFRDFFGDVQPLYQERPELSSAATKLVLVLFLSSTADPIPAPKDFDWSRAASFPLAEDPRILAIEGDGATTSIYRAQTDVTRRGRSATFSVVPPPSADASSIAFFQLSEELTKKGILGLGVAPRSLVWNSQNLGILTFERIDGGRCYLATVVLPTLEQLEGNDFVPTGSIVSVGSAEEFANAQIELLKEMISSGAYLDSISPCPKNTHIP